MAEGLKINNLACSSRLIILTVVSGLLAGLVTCVHHWYGAMAYATPWRAGVAYWIAAIVLIVYSMLYIYRASANKIVGKTALWLFFLGAVVFQAGFTLFECVYSHVLKNLLFFGGVPQSTLLQLFPAPAYHLPDNLWFELTGLLQLVGLLATWYAYRFFRAALIK